MPETTPDTVVYFFHQHGPTVDGCREGWNPPVGLGVLEDTLQTLPEWVEDKLIAAEASRPEFATPAGHWSRWRAIPRDTAPRGKDIAGRYRGLQLDLAAHPQVLEQLRQDLAFGELYTRDTTDVDVPPLYTTALAWLSEGESDPAQWARMVRHAVACGVPRPRVACELGVDLTQVYAVVADPWRQHHLQAAAQFRAAGMVEDAEQAEAEARECETQMEPA